MEPGQDTLMNLRLTTVISPIIITKYDEMRQKIEPLFYDPVG